MASKGDWIELIRNDFKIIGEELDESIIKSMSKNNFKKFVKDKIERAAFKHLENVKMSHSKVKHIQYSKLEPQEYILNEEFSNDEISKLFSLRSRMCKVKLNFSGQYVNQNLHCSLGCSEEESQEHLISCKYLIEKHDDKYLLAECEYSDIFGNAKQQLKIMKSFSEILNIREELIQP